MCVCVSRDVTCSSDFVKPHKSSMLHELVVLLGAAWGILVCLEELCKPESLLLICYIALHLER